MKNLALFDFDGTISNRDSFLLFLWYFNKRRVSAIAVSHILQILLYKFNRYPNQKLKEIFLEKLFSGQNMIDLDKRAEKYCIHILPNIIRPGFWPRLEWHQNRKDHIVLVTASITFILEPWCRTHQIDIIGSEIEVDQLGLVTGKLVGDNCMGLEKVKRLKEQFDLAGYDEIFAYGDTESDLPLLELADSDKKFYKPFR